MKFTLGWLKDYLETDASVDQICDSLTAIGFELESVEDPAKTLNGFQVARILEATPHPQADRLQVCKVEAGDGKMRQIVCGASNARAGLTTLLAIPGTRIPASGTILGEGEIRGVKSEGMMCSAEELGLATESDGIFELPTETPLTASVASVLGCDDPVIDIAVTPNRPDGLGVYGLARDLSAKGLGRLKPLSVPELTVHPSGTLTVDLMTEACLHFVGYVIEGIKNTPSPDWMQKRLRAIGSRPISLLVDITNYIMFTFARPLHVFDADKINGTLSVGRALGGELFKALDGKTYTLPEGAPVISDDTGIIALAGIMGGEDSSCTPETTRVFVESAWFMPIDIATTGRALGLLSDARYRFERGVDPEFTAVGARLAASLIADLGGGVVTDRTEAGSPVSHTRTFLYNPERVKALTGVDISETLQKDLLTRVGFSCEESHQTNGENSTLWICQNPSWRPDIHTTADLVEEIVRLYGLEHVVSTPLPRLSDIPAPVLTDPQRRQSLIKRILAGQGLNETVSFSFIPQKIASLFGGGTPDLQLENPISSELSHMRPSLLTSLLIATETNLARGMNNLCLFEVAPVYYNSTQTGQSLHASGIRQGVKPSSWSKPEQTVDIYDAKEDLLTALVGLGVSVGGVSCTPEAPSWYHPKRSGTLKLGPKTVLGTFGQIHPKVLQAFDIKGTVVAFEINMDALPPLKAGRTHTRPALHTSPLQPLYRDFAFVVDEKVSYDSLLKAVRKADKTLLHAVKLFDIYQGSGIEDGKKSVGVTVTFWPYEATLNDQQIEALCCKIVAEVHKATGGCLRH